MPCRGAFWDGGACGGIDSGEVHLEILVTVLILAIRLDLADISTLLKPSEL